MIEMATRLRKEQRMSSKKGKPTIKQGPALERSKPVKNGKSEKQFTP